jgi:hypothetical protein
MKRPARAGAWASKLPLGFTDSGKAAMRRDLLRVLAL